MNRNRKGEDDIRGQVERKQQQQMGWPNVPNSIPVKSVSQLPRDDKITKRVGAPVNDIFLVQVREVEGSRVV